MGNDPYRDWADRYDLFPEDRSEETGFFEKLFSENRVRRVLDCACGTGNELLIFDALGCDVVGSDISDSMLTHARERIDESGAQIPLRKYRSIGWTTAACRINSLRSLTQWSAGLRQLCT